MTKIHLQIFSWGALCFVSGAMVIGSYGREWHWLFAFAGGLVAGGAVTLLTVLSKKGNLNAIE